MAVIPIRRAPVAPAHETYVEIDRAARLRFDGLASKVAGARVTFSGLYTTAAKKAEAKRALVEIEREARLIREAL